MGLHHKSKDALLSLKGLEKAESLRDFDKIVSKKFGFVCGIDEAGRGPVAGPVYAAAVVLDPQNPIEGLNDSKKLTAKRREALYKEIRKKALAFSVSYASAEEIDGSDILSATLLAMSRAFDTLNMQPEIVLVDGNILPELNDPFDNKKKFGGEVKNVIGGDAKSEAIAAASILAKVSRDEEMGEIAKQYPAYGFEKNKGYGTKAHFEAIEANGLCPVHRKTFLKKYLDKK